jgi:glycosyltransferase 2 family protein
VSQVPTAVLPAQPNIGTQARVARVLGYAVAAFALVELVRTVDLSGARELVTRVGPSGFVVLIPFAIQVVLEASTWRLLLARLGHHVRWVVALRTTLGAEGVRLCFPGGAVVGDSLRPVLFWQRGKVPIRDGAAVLAVRKLGQVGAQGVFLFLGAWAGSSLLAPVGVKMRMGGALPLVAAVGGGALLCAALLVGFVLARGDVASLAVRLVTGLTRGRLARWLQARRASYTALDAQLAVLLSRSPGELAYSGATALAGWLLDALETWLLLRFLGAPVSAGGAIALEATVSVVRALAFAVPGGLGAQDLGYHMLLIGAAGGPAAAAFVLLKRARDVTWSTLGLLSRPV